MKKLTKQSRGKHKTRRVSSMSGRYSSGGGDAVYGLGFIGALIYFIGHAVTFWDGLVGLLKAIVWPAYMVYELFNFLIK
jgi:hypothetical protein